MANKMQAMLKDPKSRNTIYTLGFVVAICTGVGVVMLSTSNSKKEVVAGASKVAGPSASVNTTPGGSDSIEYIAKLEEANRLKAEKALESGKTSTGVLTGGSNLSDVSPLDRLSDARSVKEDAVKEEVEIIPPEPVALPLVSVTAAPPETKQVYAAAPPPRFGTTEDYYILQAAASVWAAKPSRSEYNYIGQGNPLAPTQQAIDAQQQAEISSRANQALTVAKSGDIMNAVLETGINSDEPSPVLASIVSGQFKGARLIGAAKRRNEKMIVEFNTISIPGRSVSDPISAVAIDIASMEQATTLASSVNNHYFKKYGLLLAAGLLTGYADAIKDQNKISVVTPEGSVITAPTGEKKSSKQINRESIGSVGKVIGQEVKSESAGIVPTVRVNRGTAIGILLMDDFKLKNNKQ